MKYAIKKTIPLTLAVSLLCQSAWSATPVDLRYQSVTVLQPRMMATGNKPGDSTFEQTSSYLDRNNTLHVRIQQKFQGYPVWGGHSVVHTPNQGKKKLNFTTLDKAKTRMNGLMYQNLAEDLKAVSTPPASEIQRAKALDYAIAYYQTKAKIPTVVSRTKANLMVYVDQKNTAHWAYYIEFLAKAEHAPRLKPVYIVNATTHEIYASRNNLHTAEKEKVKAGGFGGNLKSGKIIYDGERGDAAPLTLFRDSELGICYLQNEIISIKDIRTEGKLAEFSCKQQNEKRGNTYWNDSDESDTIGAYSPDNDAFYHTSIVKDLFLLWYKRPVLVNSDNTAKQIEVNTHLDDSNAMWDDDLKAVFFGDGDKIDFLPFVSLDIVAHELGHGFTMQNSNLVYRGESGGLNEAFSDMMSVAASYFVTGKSNWKLGGDIAITTPALRYLDNPRRDCIGGKVEILIGGAKIRNCSIDHMKDFRAGNIDIGPFHIPLVDVHLSSGIFNKAFYLMAQGWGGDEKAGTRKAFDVMVHANTAYWTPTTTFAEAACGVMNAAHDYGYDEAVVTKAMAAVGIDTGTC